MYVNYIILINWVHTTAVIASLSKNYFNQVSELRQCSFWQTLSKVIILLYLAARGGARAKMYTLRPYVYKIFVCQKVQ